jgi:hypothetical protein
MANRPAQVTQSEISRTVKGVIDGGFAIGRVEVDHRTGRVIIWPAGAPKDTGANPCDELLG